MSAIQTILSFPVRKSSRRKLKADKENVTNESIPISPTKQKSGKPSLYSESTSDVSVKKKEANLAKKETLYSEKELSNILQQQTTPKKRNSLRHEYGISPSKRVSPDKSLLDLGSPSKQRANCLTDEVTPMSPSKFTNADATDKNRKGQGTPTARKKLPMSDNENCNSSRMLSRLLFDDTPRKYASSATRTAGSMLSPRKIASLSSPKKGMTSYQEKDPTSSPINSPKKHQLSSPKCAIRCSPRKLPTPRKDQACSANSVITSTPKSSNTDLFALAKCALNTQQPNQVLCREKEIAHISTFLDIHINGGGKSGSLYISGAPGTGKTAVIKHLLEQRSQDIAQSVFINSMTVKSPFAMYKTIATEFIGPKASSVKSSKHACEMLQKHLTTSGKKVLLVLDEMDQLDTKHQEVLYTIFEWPSVPKSRLILIGIANALDLTDRILPRLNVKVECKPELLHFKPYTKEQIVTVIESRLQETPKVLDRSAMVFCARKVSAVAGDMRKALDICRRSLEFSQLSSRKHDLLMLKGGSLLCTPTSSATATPSTPRSVGIPQVASVINEVYGSASTSARPSTFPLQQKLAVCTLLLMLKSSKLKELTLGKVHDAYQRVCKKRDVAPTDQSEFISLCQLLETRGLVSLKKAKEARLVKVSLKLDAKELEFALKDKLLISSVLEAGL